MIDIPQYLVNWALGVSTGAMGWFARELWGAHKELRASLRDLEIKVAGEYVSNARLELLQTALFAKLDRIEDKLDAKVDKHP